MVILAQVYTLPGQELFNDAGISFRMSATGSTWISLFRVLQAYSCSCWSFHMFHFHILSWMMQNGGQYLNTDEIKRCKNFVHLQWLRRSLVISSASWRVAPHCVDPEGILDWWVKTEQGKRGQLLPLRDLFPSDCCDKIGRWWKMSVSCFFFPLSNIVVNWVVRGFGGI